MSRWSFVIVAVLLSIGVYPTNAKSKAEFEVAFKQSNRDKETPAGKRYTREFEDKIFLAVASRSMQTCVSRSRDTVDPAMLVFIISADGKIRRVLSTPGIEYGECIVSQLRLPISVPRPPHDNFAVALGVANHSHAQSKALPDNAYSSNLGVTFQNVTELR